MPKPKDARVWNEDLVLGLEARHQKSLRESKRDAHTWRKGVDDIQKVRGDIYQFGTGRIVNLPAGLSKTVQRTCEDIIRGVKAIYPDGHVPTNNDGSRTGNRSGSCSSNANAPPAASIGRASAAKKRVRGGQLGDDDFGKAAASSSSSDNNPYNNDHYMKHIKIRGGAYAILMAFHYSQTDVLRKAQICREAQKFCDEQMEANYMAGRPHGAWSGNKTLQDHHLLTERNFRAFGSGGYRDKPHEYTLTRDGKLFIEALLRNRPEAVIAATNAAGRSPFVGSGSSGKIRATMEGMSALDSDLVGDSFPMSWGNSPVPSGEMGATMGGMSALDSDLVGDSFPMSWGRSPMPRGGMGATMGGMSGLDSDLAGGFFPVSSSHNSATRTISSAPAKNKLSKDDILELERWWPCAEVGDFKTFKVGKERRKFIHRRVDALLAEHPGLRMTHSSRGEGRQREMRIQLVSKPSSYSVASSSANRKRPASACHSSFPSFPGYGQSLSPVPKKRPRSTARDNAAAAAMSRLERSRGGTAEEEDTKKALASSKTDILEIDCDQGEEEQMQRAIRDSLLESSAKARSSSSTKANAKKPALTSIDCRKRAAPTASIDLSLNSPDEVLRKPVFSRDRATRPKKPNRSNKESSSNLNNRKRPANGGIQKTANGNDSDDSIEIVDGNGESKSKFDSDSDSADEMLCKPVFSRDHATRPRQRNCTNKVTSSNLNNQKGPAKGIIQKSRNGNESDDSIEVVDSNGTSKPKFIDLLNSCEREESDANDDDDEDIILVDNNSQTNASSIDHELVVLIDNRERNRNATPRTLRMQLESHLSSSSGPMSAIWPSGVSCRVEEARLSYGDFCFDKIRVDGGERSRMGVAVERKRVNDLVQRSYDGDHLSQLMKMQQQHSLAVLLIEYDTRMAGGVTAYGAQNRDDFDPFDTTITGEDDVFRLFGRLVLSSNNVKIIQSKDEQSSLRAISALGLMSLAAPEEKTKLSATNGSTSESGNALCDTLKDGGIPWQLAKRVSSIIGGLAQMKMVFKSCSNDEVRSKVLAPIMTMNGEAALDGLRSTPEGWANAAYRIIQSSDATKPNQFSGEGSLLMHKELVEDHGIYLSHLHQQLSPEEALNRTLDTSNTLSSKQKRFVSISLTQDQQSKYFEMPTPGDGAFYRLTISNEQSSVGVSPAVVMQTKCGSLASMELQIFELEGSTIIVDMIEHLWGSNSGKLDYVKLAQLLAKRIDAKCKCQSTCEAGRRRIVLICGLQAALDSHARKAGYRVETKALLDMAFADIMLRYSDLTIIHALRKKIEDRVNVMKQLAMACFHFALTPAQVFE